MMKKMNSGFDTLFEVCQASGGSMASIESAVIGVAVNSGVRSVMDGGIHISAAEVAAVVPVVKEAWQTSGGSKSLFMNKLKQRLNIVDGGKKILAMLSLACLLQTMAAPFAMGVLDISSGVTSTGLSLCSTGACTNSRANVSSAGIVSTTAVSTGGYVYIFNGGVAVDTTITTGGHMNISSGGVASDVVLSTGASFFVSRGGLVSNLTVSGATVVSVYGGSAVNTVISNGDMEIRSSGVVGNATSLRIEAGTFNIYDGGILQNVTINGGTVYANDKTYANDVTVNGGGTMEYYNGGIGSNVTVNSGGTVRARGTSIISSIEVKSGATLDISAMAIVTGIVQSSGGAILAMTSGTPTGGTPGSISGVTIDPTLPGGSRSFSYIPDITSAYSSAYASNFTIYDGGRLIISSVSNPYGASGFNYLPYGAIGTIVSSGGELRLNSAYNAIANDTIAIDTVVKAGGSLVFATSTNRLGGYTVLEEGAVLQPLSDYTKAPGFQLVEGATLTIENDNTYPLSALITGQGSLIKTGTGEMKILKSNAYTGRTVVSAGSMTVDAAGDIAGLTASSGGLVIGDNATFNYSAKNTSNLSYSYLELGSNAVIVASGGSYVLDVGSGLVHSGGVMSAIDSAVVSNVTLESGGTLIASALAKANNIVQNAGGIINAYITSGGEITGTTIDSNLPGGTRAFSYIPGTSPIASNFTIYNSGELIISATSTAGGSTATSAVGTIVNSGGKLELTSTTGLTDDNIAIDTVVQSGGSFVYNTPDNRLGGSTFLANGAILSAAGGAAGFKLVSNATLTIEHTDASPYNLSALITGDGSLIKTGSGPMNVTSANTYTGQTVVSGGTMSLDAGASIAGLSSPTGGLILGADATFDYTSTGTSSMTLSYLELLGANAKISAGALTNNVLDLKGAKVVFDLPSALSGTTTPMLTIDGTAEMNSGTSIVLNDTLIATPRPEEVFELFLIDSATTSSGQYDVTGVDQASVTTASGFEYDVTIDPATGFMVMALNLDSPKASLAPWYDRLKSYSEAIAGGLATLTQSYDFIASEGLGAAQTALSAPGPIFRPFAAVGGGSLRYETGSHVDVKGFSALVGAALAPEFSNGKMLFGVFMEGGKNDYDTYSFIPNYRDVDGKGDSTYFGAGLMFRYTLTGGAASGLYVEASTRFGKSRTKFHTLDILHNNDPASFNISTNYYGFHGGLGYVIPLGGNGLNLDLSAKLFYLHQQGANAIVHGDLVNFDNADSLRLLAGGRLNFRSAGIVRPYVGAYFNHEFKGDARATVNDRPIAAPTLKGSSGKAELGIVLHPSESIPIFLDLGVQGYFGRVRGVSGTASFRYNF